MSQPIATVGCGCSIVGGFNYISKALKEKKIEALPFLTSVLEKQTKPSADPSSQIFCNGVIRPMTDGDADGTIEALAIEGSEVKAAGSLAECRRVCPAAVIVDLQGKTILPGFVEPHVHMINASVFDMWVQVGPFDGQRLVGEKYTMDWALNRMRNVLETDAESYVRGGWFCGFGMDPSMFAKTGQEWVNPTSDVLDSMVSDEVCVFIMNSSCHLGYANTKALQRAGSGNTNGILVELEYLQVVTKAIEDMANADQLGFVMTVLRNFREKTKAASSLGVTLMWDAFIGTSQKREELEFYDQVASRGALPVRYGGGLGVTTEAGYKNWTKQGLTPKTFNQEKFRVPSVKLVSDGSNQGLTGYQRLKYPNPDPILNDPHPHGVFNFDEEYFEGDYVQTMKDIDNAGWALMVHANGDQAISKVLEAFKEVCADNEDAKSKRHRIEHCSLPTESMLATMVDCGISPSFLIGHVGYWGKTFSTKVFHPRKANRLDPVASAQEAGMRPTLHSDHPVSPMGPLRMAEQAVMRVMEADPDGAVLNKDERISMADALRAITYDAAWQCHMDDLCGELVEGKKADFVILEKDPMSMADNPAGLRDIKVCQTWMDGKARYSAQ